MKIEEAKAVVAENDAKYARASQIVYDLVFNKLELLCRDSAITRDGFARLVAVPHGEQPPPGCRGGPWIGTRTLLDEEVINPGTVARIVVEEAITVPGEAVSAVIFSSFMAPSVVRVLIGMRAKEFGELGWLGRVACATPLGRHVRRQSYDLLSTLDALLIPPDEQDPAVQELSAARRLVSMVDEFNAIIQALGSADPTLRAGVAMTVHILWHAFNEKFPGPRDFQCATEQVKNNYITDIDQFVELSASDEPIGKAPRGTSLGARLFAMFLRALAADDHELVGSMIDALEPLNRAAYDIRVAI